MNYDQLIRDIMCVDVVAFDASIKAALDTIDIPSFLSYLHHHKMGGIVAHRLKKLQLYDVLSVELTSELDKYSRAVTLYNQMAKDELIRFAQFASAPVYLVKGIAFECDQLYPRGARAVGDLDVVMNYPNCTKAWDLAVQSGEYKPREAFLSNIHKRILNRYPSYEHHHLPALRSKEFSMLMIEIHPQIYNPTMDVDLDLEESFHRYSSEALLLARPVSDVPGCYQLDDVDHFLFICMHLMDNWHQGEVIWRMLCDVQFFLTSHPTFNWERCVEIANGLRTYHSLIQSLSIVNTYLSIPIPSSIVLHFEDFPTEIKSLNLLGIEHNTNAPLSKRLFFYMRHMSVFETMVYMFKTLFPDRLYLKSKYSVRYATKGYFSCVMKHLNEKLRFFFRTT